MKILKNTKKLITALLVSVAIFLSGQVFLSAFSLRAAKAETITYSDVLDDLRKDENFKVENYPGYSYAEIKKLNEDEDSTNDISFMDVIALVEGYNKELYIYVYNPTKSELNITAYQVSMYCEYASNPKEFHPELYDLELVSTYSVFDKFVVKDFVVSDDADRYYNIIELSRPFNETIDTSIENGTTDDKAISIGKQWYCYYYNDELIYEMGKFNTLEIKVTLTGNIYYGNGFTLGNLVGIYEECNSWFISFNAENYIIEHIYDADLIYNSRYVVDFVSSSISGGDETTYTPETGFDQNYVTITDNDEVKHEGKGLFGKTYTWNRISKANDFVSNFEDQGGILNNVSKEKLLESQWVFAFVETEYSKEFRYNSIGLGVQEFVGVKTKYTEVSKVDILRIHFVDVNGDYYNLGVVGDKTTADKIPDGYGNGIDIDLMKKSFIIIFALIVLLIIVVALGPFLSPVITFLFNFLGKLFRLLFKFLWSIITFPFKLFKRSSTKKRKR